ncbi:hypothetical protein HDU80_006503 [Chytriomyces hyalinus]|nr:hypothetical protein HDU80_006503 [Chytriomyces hyalinus]
MRLVWFSICILASALSGGLAQSTLTSTKAPEPTSPAPKPQRKGHYNYKIVNMKDIIKAGASCDAALRITGTPTCEQLIDMTGMDWNSFIKINKFLNCLEPLKKGMLVCVPPAASVGELPAHIPVPASKSQTKGAATATAIATSSKTKATTSDTLTVSVDVTTTEAPPAPSPDPPPPVEEVAPPAPEQPASSPGGVDAGSCIAEFARARSTYNGGNVNPYLSWSGRLSDLAQQSADYAANYNCCDASCHTLSGGGSGIAQVLYCGQYSCSSAYNGWVTDEAPYQDAAAVNNTIKGHYNYKIKNVAQIASASCKSAIRITGTPTCGQLIDLLAMDESVFLQLNPFLDCSLSLQPKTLVCMPSPTDPFNTTLTVPNSKVAGTVAATGTIEATSTTPSAANTETTSSPTHATPNYNVDQGECISLFASARSEYNGGNVNPYLTYSDRLAELAQQSADMAASAGCCDESCHTLSGGGYGIAQNLYCGQLSCGSAYQGWVTDEASYQGGHWSTIVGYPADYPYFGCAVSGVNGGAIVCNFSWSP